MYCAAVAKAHFGFGGMHVDIHQRRIDIEKQRERRMAVVMQHILIRLTYRVREQFVAHVAAVHIEVLCVARGFRHRG